MSTELNDNKISIFTNNSLQVPAVYLRILGVEFGLADFESMKSIDITQTIYERPRTPKSLITYPNLITSLKVDKITDADTNTYDLVLQYQPGDNEDPNYIDKLLSANVTQNDSKLIIAYGDASTDGYFNKKQECTITKYSMKLDVESATMTYNIHAVSTASALTLFTDKDGNPVSTTEIPDSNKLGDRPSMIIKTMWNNDIKYGLKRLFPGGIYIEDKHIDDITKDNAPDGILENTKIDGDQYSPTQYLIKLVTEYMFTKDVGATLKSCKFIYVFDDSYTDTSQRAFRIYRSPGGMDSNNDYIDELSVGMKDSPVISYEFDEDNTTAIAVSYGFNQKPSDTYKYYIDDDGNEQVITNVIGKSVDGDRLAALRDKSWWSTLASIPSGLNITTRGVKYQLPLMSKILINTYIKNQLHYSSGIYQIMKTYDEISTKGYTSQFVMFKVGNTKNYSLDEDELQLIKSVYYNEE